MSSEQQEPSGFTDLTDQPAVTTVQEVSHVEMPNPTEEDLKDPLFNAIYESCKHWDVNVPESYAGYCGLNGSHAKIILDAIRPVIKDLEEAWTSAKAIHLLANVISAVGRNNPGILDKLQTLPAEGEDSQQTLFRILITMARVAQESGLSVRVNVPTLKESQERGAISSVVVSSASSGKTLLYPEPTTYGVKHD